MWILKDVLRLSLVTFLFVQQGASDGVFLRRNVQQVIAPAICDSIETVGDRTTCFLSTDQVWSEQALSITPDTIRTGDDPDRPQLPSKRVNALHITEDTSIACDGVLCKLQISGFQAIMIEGTVWGSHVAIISLGSIVLESSKALIDVQGKGYGSRAGPGKGYLITGNVQECLVNNKRVAGAGHGGKGGTWCGYSRPQNIYDKTGTDYGSGGYGICGGQISTGGGIIHLTAKTSIAISGGAKVNANAGPESYCSGLCGGGSGGSIIMEAVSVVGSGDITANGADAVAGGGGGRIIIRSDLFEQSNFLVQVKGGSPSSDRCPEAIGENGSIQTSCLTSICYNGGSFLAEQCGCQCGGYWDGQDCSTCTRSCLRGVLDTATCTCTCPVGWTGENCDVCDVVKWCNGQGSCNLDGDDVKCSCDEDWYGSSCSNYCVRELQCTSNGICAADGSGCICREGKAGEDCFCDVCLDDSECSGNGACAGGECLCGSGWAGCDCLVPCDCSGRGRCDYKGTCLCAEGFAGSKCDIPCKYCHGNGQCNKDDGTCKCNPGFVGSQCVPDPQIYCSQNKCLPGILNTLGYGWNHLTGSRTRPILQLSFTQDRSVVFDGKSYKIPDYVNVIPKTTSKRVFTTYEFRDTSTLRSFLSQSVSGSGGTKAASMSLNDEYEELVQRSFMQESLLFISVLEDQLYEVIIDDAVIDITMSTEAQNAKDVLSGSRRIESLGTGYIKSAVYGGKLNVFYFVDAKLVSEISSNQIKQEASATALSVASSTEQSGEVGQTITSESEETCFEKFAQFSKEVNGGKRSALIVNTVDTQAALREWLGSLVESPAIVKMNLNPIEYVYPDLSEDAEDFWNTVDIQEVDLDEMDFSDTSVNACPIDEKESDLPWWRQPFWRRSLFWVVIAVIAVVALIVVCVCCRCKK